MDGGRRTEDEGLRKEDVRRRRRRERGGKSNQKFEEK